MSDHLDDAQAAKCRVGLHARAVGNQKGSAAVPTLCSEYAAKHSTIRVVHNHRPHADTHRLCTSNQPTRLDTDTCSGRNRCFGLHRSDRAPAHTHL
jgi:hypothetical protein